MLRVSYHKAMGDRQQQWRTAWRETMQMFQSLAYQPIWDATHFVLEPPESKPLFKRLNELPSVDSGDRKYTPALESFVGWRTRVAIPRAHLIDKLATAKIPSCKALLLQGSLADGKIVEGYSDCDIVVILEVPPSTQALAEQIVAVRNLNHILVAYNPLMHHGPSVYYEPALANISEATLPSAILKNSVLLQGSPFTVHYGADCGEAQAAIDGFGHFFDVRWARGPASIRSAFDALWWISNGAILPLLAYQRDTGESIWKRDLLLTRNDPFIRRLTDARVALGAIIAERLTSEWPIDANVNPGLARNTLQLNEADRNAIGIDDKLLQMGRDAYRAASNAWPRRAFNYPSPAAPQEYDDLRTNWLHVAAGSVYEFGSVCCPGLSDLDLLFVVDGPDDKLSIKHLPKRQQHLMGHDPMLIAKDAMPHLPYVLPLLAIKHLAGPKFDLKRAEDLNPDTRWCAMTAYNLRKYPDDIEDLARQDPANFHLILAYLHSFSHFGKLKELDHRIREQFRDNGTVESSELSKILDAMRTASAEIIKELHHHWATRLPVAAEKAKDANLLDWIGYYLADPHAQAPPEIDEATREYRAHKRAFFDSMQRANLPIDGYLRDYRFFSDASKRRNRLLIEGAVPKAKIDFRKDVSSLLDGWSSPEDWGVWTDGPRAELFFNAASTELHITGRSFVGGALTSQTIAVEANGDLLSEWTITFNGEQQLPPVHLKSTGPTTLVFHCRTATSPKALGLSEDARRLGFGLTTIQCGKR